MTHVTPRAKVPISDEDLEYIRKHMNPHGWPLSQVLASIVMEVVRDDRAIHEQLAKPE